MMMGSGAAVSAAAQALPLIIQAAQWIYVKMTEPQPLVDREDGDDRFIDKTRYERLCRHREEFIDRENPNEWVLDAENKPSYGASFGESAKRLESHVKRLSDSTYPQKPQVLAMIRRIARLFQRLKDKKADLSKKLIEASKEVLWNYNGYRCDGFEAMFFSDLALWLSITLPSLQLHEQKTIDAVKNWIDYCNKVMDDVLIFRGDDTQANSPRLVLESIIQDLELLKADMIKAKKSADFNMKVHSIESSVLCMINESFDFLYLLIEHAPKENLQVRSLLEQHEKYVQRDTLAVDAEISKVFSCQMGLWLVETLHKAGIVSNNFRSLKSIDPELIQHHLSAISENIPLDKTGLWSFVRKPLLGETPQMCNMRANKYLNDVAEIQRLLLMMCYVREAIILGAMVGKDLGDSWIYGEDTGKGIALVLCKVILDSCHRLNEKIATFWGEFHGHYKQYIKRDPKDDRDPLYKRTVKGKSVVKEIQQRAQDIDDQIKEIQTEIKKNKRNDRDIVDKINLLKLHLSTYVRLTSLSLEENLKRIIGEQAVASHEVKIVEVTRYVFTEEQQLLPQKDIVMKYPLMTLPYYQRVKAILEGAVLPTVFSVRDPVPHSLMQQSIYQDYLQDNASILKLTEWGKNFSYYYTNNGILSKDINKFINMYYRIQAIFQLLYVYSDPHLPEKVSPIETVLIDIELQQAILKDFKKNKYYEFNALPPKPPFDIQLVGTEVHLTLTGDWYDAIKESLLGVAIGALIQGFQDKQRQLEAELKKMKELLAEKEDTVINLTQQFTERTEQNNKTVEKLNTRISNLEALLKPSERVSFSTTIEDDEEEKSSFIEDALEERASHVTVSSIDINRQDSAENKQKKPSMRKMAKNFFFGKSAPAPSQTQNSSEYKRHDATK